jgi:HTH-type transcriptional regulator/antitoxin HipB
LDYPIKMAEQLRPQLQALRKKRGLTQAQLGAAIGVTQARIVEIEANPGLVSLQQIMQVLHALDAGLVINEAEKGPAKSRQGTGTPTPAAGQKRGSW